MPAGRPARDAEPLRVDAIFLGVGPDELDRTVHLLDDLGNDVLRLAAVHDREDRVAAIEQRADGQVEVDHLLVRHPPAADAEDDSPAVGLLLRGEHVHGERDAVMAGVDHVLLASELDRGRGLLLGLGSGRLRRWEGQEGNHKGCQCHVTCIGVLR